VDRSGAFEGGGADERGSARGALPDDGGGGAAGRKGSMLRDRTGPRSAPADASGTGIAGRESGLAGRGIRLNARGSGLKLYGSDMSFRRGHEY
jgi:hypothetical protein